MQTFNCLFISVLSLKVLLLKAIDPFDRLTPPYFVQAYKYDMVHAQGLGASEEKKKKYYIILQDCSANQNAR